MGVDGGRPFMDTPFCCDYSVNQGKKMNQKRRVVLFAARDKAPGEKEI